MTGVDKLLVLVKMTFVREENKTTADKNSSPVFSTPGANELVSSEIVSAISVELPRTSVVLPFFKSNPLRKNDPKPCVAGKELQLEGKAFYVKGVTYGTFEPHESGDQYPPPEVVCEDFKLMVESGINTVRVYTVPPRWILDLAAKAGLYLMIGIPWEQHLAILEDTKLVSSIKKRFREAVLKCAGHPAVLFYSIGNEIPAHVVRWHGRKKIERFLKSLYTIIKKEDPGSLVTYVNFPTTEFLNLDFVDFYSFNVYLESEENFRSYLPRLQILAGDKPLVLAEVGLDSLRNGDVGQSESLKWQIESIYESGCAGAFVFAWTDEWYVGGRPIDDWFFGLTTHSRQAKPALASVVDAYDRAPFDAALAWPSFTIVVCSYNGSKTIRTTLNALLKLDYPLYEVIVVDDGSTDSTAEIAREYPFQLISTVNFGLSSARNTGYRAGSGEIVAYIDDDAFPGSGWLRYLALAYMRNNVAGVGGPNYPVPGDGLVADCVANAPGGPMEVMLTDTIAEHIPGCNMSFRRDALDAIGGFDTQFRAAGDDVDLCWRIQDQVGDIGFQAAAFNWHHRRDSVRGYWKQQYGYGVAEAMLERKWPEKYNSNGHISWTGRLYGQGFTQHFGYSRGRVYQGIWGSSPFQRLYNANTHGILSLTLMPEWLILMVVLTLIAASSIIWKPMLWAALPCAAAIGIWLLQAISSALKGNYDVKPRVIGAKIPRVSLTTFLHLIQPIARLRGRLTNGLSPWRAKHNEESSDFDRSIIKAGGFWDGKNQEVSDRLSEIYSELNQSIITRVGNSYDSWDLELIGGMAGGTRLSLMVEQHAEGVEFVRYRCRRVMPKIFACMIVLITAISIIGVFQERFWQAAIFAALVVPLVLRHLSDSDRAACSVIGAVERNVARQNDSVIDEINDAEESVSLEEVEDVAA